MPLGGFIKLASPYRPGAWRRAIGLGHAGEGLRARIATPRIGYQRFWATEAKTVLSVLVVLHVRVGVCVCVCCLSCMRACVHACMRACVLVLCAFACVFRVCVCVQGVH